MATMVPAWLPLPMLLPAKGFISSSFVLLFSGLSFCPSRFTTGEFVFAHMTAITNLYLSLFSLYTGQQIAERGAGVVVPE